MKFEKAVSDMENADHTTDVDIHVGIKIKISYDNK